MMKETRQQAALIYLSEDIILSLGGTPSLEQAQTRTGQAIL